MAGVEESPFSLISLEEELTCSICLHTFQCPVTIPCGHNFCQDCLLVTWKDSDFNYSCPQCRTFFATKPELKKNTVLSAVVDTFKIRAKNSEAILAEESVVTKKNVIRCDMCMEAEASRTCLTCMASYCEEHLRPHQENPIFRPHQLSEPVSDLMERICPNHQKLMDLFCSQHICPVCSYCLQEAHKGCIVTSSEERRNQTEFDLRDKLGQLDEKIVKNETVLREMGGMQNKLKDSVIDKKRAVAAEYKQIREMLAQEENNALSSLDEELESGQAKLNSLVKKFNDNVSNLSRAKADIHSLLRQSQTMAFLQGSFNLPAAMNFDPYAPRINLDSKKVKAVQACAVALKDHLSEILKQPVEARLPILKTGERQASVSGFSSPKPHQESEPQWPSDHPKQPTSQGPFSQPKPGQKKKSQSKIKENTNPSQAMGHGMGYRSQNRSMENLLEFATEDKPKGRPPWTDPKKKPETPDIPPDITSAEKRSELLKYGTVLTLDPKTAHKRIVLSEGFTKACVSEESTNYPNCPERFAVCSQVLTSKGFSQGRHYWEVRLSSNNFIGIGLAYSSIDRKGPTSRLGRNAQSWCVEWFNVKLSAWHNSSETVLVNPNPKRVGVLLDCEQGTATFYNVADRAYPFHSFIFPFAEAVYPAFWIFSSGSSISLCKLQA